MFLISTKKADLANTKITISVHDVLRSVFQLVSSTKTHSIICSLFTPALFESLIPIKFVLFLGPLLVTMLLDRHFWDNWQWISQKSINGKIR